MTGQSFWGILLSLPLEAIVYFPLEGPAKPSSAGLSPFWRLAAMAGDWGPPYHIERGERAEPPCTTPCMACGRGSTLNPIAQRENIQHPTLLTNHAVGAQPNISRSYN